MNRKEVVEFLENSAGQLIHMANVTQKMLPSSMNVFNNIIAFKRQFNQKADELLLQELIKEQIKRKQKSNNQILVPERLLSLIHEMANKIKLSHGGWHEGTPTTNR